MKRIRISFSLLLVLCAAFSVLVGQAYAHIPCMCGTPDGKCECFIQLGDKGPVVEEIIKKLINQGYLKNPRKKKEFTPEVREAVVNFQSDHNLECTGWMDDETLDALLWGVIPDSDITEQYEEERWSDIVFVPTDGGIRYHTNPRCKCMHHPRMLTRENAVKLGRQHCGLKSCPYASDLNVLMFSSSGIGHRDLPGEYYVAEETMAAGTLEDGAVVRSMGNQEEALYIGNKNSKVFHRPDCRFVQDKMNESNKIVFYSRDDAISEGYEACKVCKP